jgi:hypothetical protein
MTRILTRLTLGLSVTFLDLVLIFVSWASHPGNVAVGLGMPGAATVFPIATFPIVSFLPEAIVNKYFWTVIVGNSLLWGAAAIWLHAMYFRATSRKRLS